MSKGLMWICITVGGIVGSYIPVILFHSSAFSIASIVWGGIGSLAGIWLAVKLNSYGY